MVTIATAFQLGSDFPKIDYSTWRKQVEVDLKGAPFDKRMLSRSYEGIELQGLYTEEIFPTAGDPGGLPGYPPFVSARGSWVMRWPAGTSARNTRIPIRPSPTRRSSRISMAA